MRCDSRKEPDAPCLRSRLTAEPAALTRTTSKRPVQFSSKTSCCGRYTNEKGVCGPQECAGGRAPNTGRGLGEFQIQNGAGASARGQARGQSARLGLGGGAKGARSPRSTRPVGTPAAHAPVGRAARGAWGPRESAVAARPEARPLLSSRGCCCVVRRPAPLEASRRTGGAGTRAQPATITRQRD